MTGINRWPNVWGGFGYGYNQQPNNYGSFTLPTPANSFPNSFPGYPNSFPGYPNSFPGYPNSFPAPLTDQSVSTELTKVDAKGGKGGKGGKGDGKGDKGDGKDGNGGSTADLSGKGSIRANSFKTADGERWEPAVKAGETYNLLSDGGVALNGTYASKGSETILGKVGLKVGGSTVTLAADGTFKIDGKEFKKGKNDLDGAVKLKNGTYTITTDEGYTFMLKASETSGVSVDIEAKDVGADGITPDGLWGAAFDGDKQKAEDLKKDFKPRDYEIADILTFDYEDNNALTDQDTLDDEDRNQRIWDAENPTLSSVQLRMYNEDKGKFSVYGPGAKDDDVYWNMSDLKTGRYYNVFSDEGVQVNGKFNSSGRPQELGFNVNGEEVKVVRTSAGKLEVTVNGTVVTSYNSNGIVLKDGKLSIKSDSDEGWTFGVGLANDGLNFLASGTNIGSNKTRSSGLLGDAISGNLKDNGNDKNGAGYLRNEDGALSKAGDDLKAALEAFVVDDLFDTTSGRSVFDY